MTSASFDVQQLAVLADYLGADHARSNLIQDLVCLAEEFVELGTQLTPLADAMSAGQPAERPVEQLHALAQSHAELAQAVRDGIRLVASYTHQQRDTAAIIHGTLRLTKREFDLAVLLREVERVIGVRFERVPCRLAISYEPAFIHGDAERLFRVIYLLLENSHGYVSTYRDDDDGVVEVWLSRDESQVIITVQDNGPGIDPSIRDRLGEPGFRGTTLVPGAGWSLFFVKAVVEAHGGHIVFGSRTDGQQGAQVTISLPMAEGKRETV